MKTQTQQQVSLQAVRSDQMERERFLNALLKRNGARIFRTLTAHVKPGTQMFSDLMNGDLQQAFLLGANKALDKFRETDDGRGKNDYAGFCSWSGINAVLDRIRQATREVQYRTHEYPAGSLAFGDTNHPDYGKHHDDIRKFVAPSYVYVSTCDPVRDLLAYEMINAFLPKLDPRDRLVAELMLQGYGPSQRNNDPAEENRGRRQNYLHELEIATGYSEQKLMASIRRLRIAAEEHFEYTPRG